MVKAEGRIQTPERKVSCESAHSRPTTLMDRRKSLQIIPHQLVVATIIANEKLDKRRKSSCQTLPISIKGVLRILFEQILFNTFASLRYGYEMNSI